MDPKDAGRPDARFEDDEAMAPVLAIVHGLPDATVGSREDGRIVFANALAGELFGYAPEEMVGRHVQTLWPERVRERYLRNMRLYFATEHPLRFTTEAWGLRGRRLGVRRRDELGDRRYAGRAAAARDRARRLRAPRRRAAAARRVGCCSPSRLFRRVMGGWRPMAECRRRWL